MAGSMGANKQHESQTYYESQIGSWSGWNNIKFENLQQKTHRAVNIQCGWLRGNLQESEFVAWDQCVFFDHPSTQMPRGSCMNGKELDFLNSDHLAMDQYLYIACFGGWTSSNPSYFDHQGCKVLTHLPPRVYSAWCCAASWSNWRCRWFQWRCQCWSSYCRAEAWVFQAAGKPHSTLGNPTQSQRNALNFRLRNHPSLVAELPTVPISWLKSPLPWIFPVLIICGFNPDLNPSPSEPRYISASCSGSEPLRRARPQEAAWELVIFFGLMNP